jgi:hypothetical protein
LSSASLRSVRQHALHYQHALGDHKPFAGRQIGTAIHAVQVAEIVESRIVGIVDVLNIHVIVKIHPVKTTRAGVCSRAFVDFHGLSSTRAKIRSAALRRV